MKYLFTLSIFGLILLLPNSIRAQKTAATAKPVVPIIDVPSGYLLGGSQGGKWVSAKVAAQSMKNGANIRVFSSSRTLGTGSATAPKSQGAPCPDTLFSKISLDFPKQNAQFALAGTAKVLIRPVEMQNGNQAIYRAEIAKTLRAKGMTSPQVEISQLWRVDLDGDGQKEVLISATRKADWGSPDTIQPASRDGDYSLILLRKIVRGRVKSMLLEGEFYPRAKEFNAPNFYRLAAVFDANGDGNMEILLRGRYYEGDWASLYEIRGETPRAVLSEGCGA